MKLQSPARSYVRSFLLCLSGLLVLTSMLAGWSKSWPRGQSAETGQSSADRSPVDLLLTNDEKYLLVVNQTSGTLALVETASGKVLSELPCGEKPSALALTPDGKTVLVSATWTGELVRFSLENAKLVRKDALFLGFEPRGVAVSPDGKTAYVALSSGGVVASVDLAHFKETARVAVGRWPRYLALSPDGKRLAVGVNGEGGVAVVDVLAGKKLFLEDFVGLNLGHMQVSSDGQYVYFPWIVYGHNPITANNIRQGWVLASRIARVRLDRKARREALALDPRGQAVADPHGLALSPDEKTLVCTASGTQELLVYRLPGLPFMDYGGPGDHIHPDLLANPQRFFRIPLGGRPLAARFARDGRTVYVANYLLNCVQVVDLPEKKVVRRLDLGGPDKPSLARQGEAIFYDGRRSLDQWYSCHSCHYEGHTNAQAMDTRNDGRFGNFKVVLSLRNVTHTGPWTWHGWQKDLPAAMLKSLSDTMLPQQRPTEQDARALIAFLDTLKLPPNPFRSRDGRLTEAAARGEKVFRGEIANCSRCHSGAYFTDGKIHNVGTGSREDVYRGFNTPSLLGVHDRVLLLHDGRVRSLEALLTGPHAPEKVTGRGTLSKAQLQDLIEYLKSL